MEEVEMDKASWEVETWWKMMEIEKFIDKKRERKTYRKRERGEV